MFFRNEESEITQELDEKLLYALIPFFPLRIIIFSSTLYITKLSSHYSPVNDGYCFSDIDPLEFDS